MLRIEIQGHLKHGRSTVAALIYSLLGDYGVEAQVEGFDKEYICKLAGGDPTELVKRARAVLTRTPEGQPQRVVIIEKQLPRKSMRGA